MDKKSVLLDVVNSKVFKMFLILLWMFAIIVLSQIELNKYQNLSFFVINFCSFLLLINGFYPFDAYRQKEDSED